MGERLYTVPEIAERLHCSVGFAYGLLASGRLKHYALGRGQGGKRVSEEQLQEYLRSVERGGVPAARASRPTRPAGTFTELDPKRLQRAWESQ